jgi:hypothetical protein
MLMRFIQAFACFARISSPTNLREDEYFQMHIESMRYINKCLQVIFANRKLTHADGSKGDEGPLSWTRAFRWKENQA